MVLASKDASWWELTSDVQFIRFSLHLAAKIVFKKCFLKSGFWSD
jgi:hypothetical protein